ncbi:MAG: hypothetical protein ACLT16_13250 [[Clostridium] innocuum]
MDQIDLKDIKINVIYSLQPECNDGVYDKNAVTEVWVDAADVNGEGRGFTQQASIC